MGKLHDMKTGASNKIVAVASRGISKFLGGHKQIDLEKICADEDPVKVIGFLEDVSNEESLPKSVRDACKILLEQYKAGKPLGEAMQESTTEQIQKLETDLKKSVGR